MAALVSQGAGWQYQYTGVGAGVRGDYITCERCSGSCGCAGYWDGREAEGGADEDAGRGTITGDEEGAVREV